MLQVALSNDKDSLTTRVAYLLNLTGPCYTVQTYCSTSLVATCIACSSLLSGECDIALAGGAAISVPQKAGYSYQEGGIASPDARCRAFDAKGNGSPLGNGVGMVVLKRLENALKDGDSIHAVIKGSAINNDGSLKVGFTAPGVRGQAQVILEALANADMQAEDISYIEAHGTGTPLGDVVELTALIKAFRTSTHKKNFCAIGSVKTNVGHLDRAAGVTGLIKTTLALKHKLLPASLNYTEPNPQIDLQNSPFYVNTQLTEWKAGATPLRAGVSAFGIGGTNAHVIIEEPPHYTPVPSSRSSQLLLLSARTEHALDVATKNLETYLRAHPEIPLADIAYTLQVGRKVFEYRRALVCSNHEEALHTLETHDNNHLLDATTQPSGNTVAFLFSGNEQLDNRAVSILYSQEPAFRNAVDQCHRYLKTHFSLNILDALLINDIHEHSSSALPSREEHTISTGKPELSELSDFVAQYALAQMFMAWKVIPRAMLGYGRDEYVAACLAGVFSLEDALTLLVYQMQLLHKDMPHKLLDAGHTLSASQATMPGTIKLHAPTIPFISSTTGTWITPEQAKDPSYWAPHPYQTPPIADAIPLLLKEAQLVLEIGLDGSPVSSSIPSSVLSSSQLPFYHNEQITQILTLSSGPADDIQSVLQRTLGKLWIAGVSIDWQSFSAHEHRQRVPLPTYPFERIRYWIDPSSLQALEPHAPQQSLDEKKADKADWFYRTRWQKQTRAAPVQLSLLPEHGPFLLFLDQGNVGTQLMQRLIHEGQIVTGVQAGDHFEQLEAHTFCIRAQELLDYTQLLQLLKNTDAMPKTIVYCWGMDSSSTLNVESFESYTESGLYSLLNLVRALDRYIDDDTLKMLVVSNQGQWVTGSEELHPEQSMLPGMCMVISQEHFAIACHNVDIDVSQEARPQERHIQHLLEAIVTHPTGMISAYRKDQSWTQAFEPVRLEQEPVTRSRLRQKGVYLITGGLGNVGFALADYLTEQIQARLVLLSHSHFPPRSAWGTWLQENDEHEPISRKIRHLQALEARGAEILLLQADVADEQQMRTAIQQIDARYGTLHGIIHAAGVTRENAFRAIDEIGPQECQWHFRSKVHGAFTLEKIVQGRSLDFCVLFSSLSATLGGLGFVAYTAANAFMDAVVHRYNQSSPFPWISIDWDTWQFAQEQKTGTALGQSVARYAMTLEEGTDIFTRILTQKDLRHIIISTGDLQTRIRQWIQLESLQDRGKAETSARASTHAPAPEKEEYTRAVSEIWQQVLGIDTIGADDNFFELGGNSLLGLQVIAKLKKAFHKPVPAVALFEAPTIGSLVKYLLPREEIAQKPRGADLTQRRQQARRAVDQQGVAIIGMAGRFPGAATLEQFWQNLHDGVESITVFSDEELLEAGVDPAQLRAPNYIKARPILNQVDQFDAPFFGYSPREAALMDPQHRLFMECSWEALEMAGYDPLTYQGLIGAFGGANISTYLLSLATDPEILNSVDDYQIVMGNDKDSLTTSVSYKLNLKGPSFAVQTFCSTSLVATHLACQSLLNGECDIALAGGVSIRVPTKNGYVYNDGGMESPDGHCRTFDAQAKGTLFGDGVGVVVLKRLSEALEDGDPICAVIKGSAINNDGSLKVSYTAPSVVGQTKVVEMALAVAGIEASTISYIEAHGTATELGDPIELASLTKAFRSQTDKTGYCAIGSVKTNFGHLDRAAGASGLIKTVLALQHAEIPPSLHYQSPNPEIDFEHSPFYVNTQLSPWKQGQTPRRAGINSLGMGGTNAHVILEEAPPCSLSGPTRSHQLLLLSARTATALDKSRLNLLSYLQQHEEGNLDDIAYTLQVGRHRFEHRLMLMGKSREQVITALETGDPAQILQHFDQHSDRPVVFLFPGIGEHYPGMARELYQQEAAFRQVIDTCCTYLQQHHNLDLRPALQLDLPAESDPSSNHSSGPNLRSLLARDTAAPTSHNPLAETRLAQPAVFVIEYALAHLLQSWGIRPHALLGYSLGEYVAACLAGVLALDDALSLVLQRANLIDALPTGAMLAVMLPTEQVETYLSTDLSLAAINGPQTCVLAGTPEAILHLESQLRYDEVAFRRIETTHAFHSHLLEPVREPLQQLLATMPLQPPQIPYISNVTGTWITAQEATDPTYWGRHLCQSVRWSQGVETLLQRGEQILLEVGPGQSLGAFVRQHPHCTREQMGWILPTLPAAQEKLSAYQVLLTTMGKVWLAGGSIDWQEMAAGQQRKRVVLPTYPFEYQRYWIQGSTQYIRSHGTSDATPEATLANLKRENPAQWFYLPGWKQTMPPSSSSPARLLEDQHCWLIFADNCAIGNSIKQRLTQNRQDVITITAGSEFLRLDADAYLINPGTAADYESLFKDIAKQGKTPEKIIHLWTVTPATYSYHKDTFSEIQEQGFFSVLRLVQSLENTGANNCQITVISSDLHAVLGSEVLVPEKATVLGACKVIPLEYPTFTCRNIDLSINDISAAHDAVISQVMAELCNESSDSIVALRNQRRWVQTFEPIALETRQEKSFPQLREKGVYLITGGLGGIGMAMAEHLAHTVHARLALLSRTELPPRAQWSTILASQGTTTHTGRQLQQLQQLEEAGSEVLVLSADVSDEDQMRAALESVVDTFGEIHGVLHAAGVPGIGLMQTKTPAMLNAVLSPKVQGTLVLDRLLQEYVLDFLVLYSSITSITGGGPGQVDYCAANAFMDAFAYQNATRHGRTLAINWGEWQWNAWGAGLSGYDPEVQEFFKKSRERFGIGFAEGFSALNQILGCPLPQVVVSTQHFPTIVELSKDFSVSMLSQKDQRRQPDSRHTRPPLANPYIAPITPLEQKVAAVWEEYLGIAGIGIHDNFFELGGHSLIGTQVILRLRQVFSTNLSTATFFEAPTIAELAVAVEMALIAEIELLDESQV
jgi:acyl transferase domain-containing protein/acyl carrier protein